MSTLNVDTILEQTSGGGVTVDGVLIKDGSVTATPKISGAAADSLLKVDGSEQIVAITKTALITLLQLAATDIVSGTFADARIAESNITQHVAALVHQSLSGAGSNTHAQIDTHIANTSNPHSVTKSQIGLGNVDNTADADKPVSTAQAAADALRLLATGAAAGATSQAQDFTNGLTIAGGSNGINASGALTAAGLDITGAADFDAGLTINGGANGFSSGGALTAASATVNGDLTVDTNSLHVDSSNNRVGIGTATPSAPLHVVAPPGYNGEIRLTRTSGLAGDFSIISGGALSPSLRFYDRAAAAERITLIGSGNVGLGITSPAAQLHVVNGTATQPALRIDAASGQTTHIFAVNNSSGTQQFGIGATGQIRTNQDSANTNTPLGATAHQLPIYNEAGTLLGYIPVYAAAW